ncbi:hypothetical protein GJ698_14540 [Pseudoduganella sp. FT26W]|uniref:Glycosyltransferase RgtA/B/C/D-like domain-containing protein n=1 Tax=Duganella aquatilis TaxID=2666082 RepID=A0A844DBY3_9BURK|nr:hypothetical protein [Duganella aquatilis]MRW85300.1 hypothetical protein [Duganella aquatilis]
MRRVSQLALAVLLGLLAVGAMTVIYLQQAVDPLMFFNSDALYLPALYHDVLVRGGHLNQWYLTPAPYFFPDWLLYFGARGVAGDTYHALAVLMAVQALALWGLLLLLVRRQAPLLQAAAAATAATAMVCFAASRAGYPYAYVMLGSYHFGTFLMVLAGLLLVLRRSVPGLALLVAATVLSDRLYALQFVLPALGMLLLLRKDFPQWRRLCLAMLAGCVAGVLLYKLKLLVPNSASMPWKLAPAFAAVRVQELLDVFSALRGPCAPLAWYVALYYLLLLSLAPGTLLGRGRWRLARPEAAWLGMFNLSATAGLLLVMALSSAPATTRYLIPMFVLPLVLGPVLLFASWRARQPALLELSQSLLLGLAAVAGAGMAHTISTGGALKQEYYPAPVACIDRVLAQYDLQHGFGGYWDAGWLAMNSHRQPSVAPVKPDLQRLNWITSMANFRDRYDFALAAPQASDGDRPSQSTVVALNGAPLAVVGCGPLNVLVYPRAGARIQ